VTEPTANEPYVLRTTPTVRRALGETLPEAVAAAAHKLITGSLLLQPYRVGKHLLPPLDDRFSARRGTYRIIYRVDDKAAQRSVQLQVRLQPGSPKSEILCLLGRCS
jgi:mRNA interferase RelE/StbE